MIWSFAMSSFTDQLLFEGCKTIGPLFLLPKNKKTLLSWKKYLFYKTGKRFGK
jgi:hypothetical protein